MGLFTDKCTNPDCGRRVRKGSKHCPYCGTPAPKGLTGCGSCGAEVRTSSKFCWRCGADLAAVRKPVILDERWARHPEDFAVRVDDQDVKGWFVKPLIIEHGTRALIFQAGKYKGEAREGRYDMGGFLKRLNHFLADLNATVVIADAGDVNIDVACGDLWTADTFEVGCGVRVVVRIDDPDAMFVNLFKGSNRVTVGALREELVGEARMLLSGIVAQHPAEALFADLSIRDRIEATLRENVAVTLGRLGLELVQLRFIEFTGEAFEALRRQRAEVRVEEGEADLVEQRAKLAGRLRETLTQQRLDEFQSEKDFEDYVRQTEHELSLKDVVRADEMERLKARFAFERDAETLLRRIEIEGIADEAAREKAWKDLLGEEDRRDERQGRDLKRRLAQAKSDLETTEVQVQIDRLSHGEKLRQSEAEHVAAMAAGRRELELQGEEIAQGIDALRKVKDVEQDMLDREQAREAATLDARSKASLDALISISDGKSAEQLVELEKFRLQKELTPEQMLMEAAKQSPEVAKALAAKYASEHKVDAARAELLEKQLADQRAMLEGFADRQQQQQSEALRQMGMVAGTAARPVDPKQTIVTGGGPGRPVVINPQAQDAAPAKCRHCGEPLQPGGAFCPECGKKQ